ncbi:hypothetical protein Tco_1581269 [Tanacetum coccineum]
MAVRVVVWCWHKMVRIMWPYGDSETLKKAQLLIMVPFRDTLKKAQLLIMSTRVFIDDRILPVSTVPTRWIKLLPIKINVFAWKVSHDALPTRLQLSLRGMEKDSNLVGAW